MAIITVIEPHPLLRLGILQLLTDVSPVTETHGKDYSCLEQDTPEPGNCDLVMLSVSSFEQLHHLASQAERVFGPKAMLLLSEADDMPHTAQGLPPSVRGYVAKDASPEVLQASVRLVLAGGTCFPMRSGTPANQPLLSRFQPVKWPPVPEKPKVAANSASTEYEMLGITPRQYEVLVLLARGYPMKTVGRCLNISVATAKAHTETLYQRLDVHNRNAAVYEAVSRGATLGWPTITGVGDDQKAEA
ncbi:response regulator transcription factor [Alcaligenaceae bacterium]|nr:response regulator transcription factor [Alcaligenaceae bacterium]